MNPGMHVRSLVSNVSGTLVYVMEHESLVEYRTRTAYGMITMREWFYNADLEAA